MFSYARSANSQRPRCRVTLSKVYPPSDSGTEPGDEKKKIVGQSLKVPGATHLRTSGLRTGLPRLFVALLIVLFLPIPARAQGQLPLTKHVRDAVAKGQAALVGRLPA